MKGKCPKCGKFCHSVMAELNEDRILSVDGVCKIHGSQILTDQDWSYEDFDPNWRSNAEVQKKASSN